MSESTIDRCYRNRVYALYTLARATEISERKTRHRDFQGNTDCSNTASWFDLGVESDFSFENLLY